MRNFRAVYFYSNILLHIRTYCFLYVCTYEHGSTKDSSFFFFIVTKFEDGSNENYSIGRENC